MSVSGDDFLKRAVAGDRDALGQLVQRHGPEVRNALRGKIPERWQCVLSEDDVLQQTYADAVVHIDQFVPQGEGPFVRWLTTIAKRNLLDAIQMLEADKRGGDHRRIEPRAEDKSYADFCELLGSTITTASRHAARNEAMSTLESAIQQLPDTYGRVVRMYDLEDRTIRDVAATLGRSEGAVFMLRSRAHDRLKEILGSGSDFLSD